MNGKADVLEKGHRTVPGRSNLSWVMEESQHSSIHSLYIAGFPMQCFTAESCSYKLPKHYATHPPCKKEQQHTELFFHGYSLPEDCSC